jgi:phosphate acyltransferase
MIRIGIDAMGGDFAPQAVVLGAIQAASKLAEGSRIVLFGDKERIEKILAQENCPADTFDIVPTSEVIEMGDNPTQAFSKKTDSSIVVGFRYLLEGKIDGFASAGSTGAMMVGCMYTVKQIDGVIRPAISVLAPTIDNSQVLLLDVGLNVDCKPDVLYQYGIIGSTFAKGVMDKPNPRVALLNIGEEKEKGNLQTKATYELMENTSDFNFVGNVEAKHVVGQVGAYACNRCGSFGRHLLKISRSLVATPALMVFSVWRTMLAIALAFEQPCPMITVELMPNTGVPPTFS